MSFLISLWCWQNLQVTVFVQWVCRVNIIPQLRQKSAPVLNGTKFCTLVICSIYLLINSINNYKVCFNFNKLFREKWKNSIDKFIHNTNQPIRIITKWSMGQLGLNYRPSLSINSSEWWLWQMVMHRSSRPTVTFSITMIVKLKSCCQRTLAINSITMVGHRI